MLFYINRHPSDADLADWLRAQKNLPPRTFEMHDGHMAFILILACFLCWTEHGREILRLTACGFICALCLLALLAIPALPVIIYVLDARE